MKRLSEYGEGKWRFLRLSCVVRYVSGPVKVDINTNVHRGIQYRIYDDIFLPANPSDIAEANKFPFGAPRRYT
jgi:hypothetical protein